MIKKNIPINKLYPDHLLLVPGKNLKQPGSDSAELFQTNLKTQPDDWYYRTYPVEYKYNSNRYRCLEWADINWSQSWVILGCSNVEGIGLDESDTLSVRISEILGEPVINLGVGGSGPDVTLFNSLRLIDKGIRPKGVILLVGEFAWTRLTVFNPVEARCLGSWSLLWKKEKWQKISYPDLYYMWTTTPDHAETHSYMCDRGATAAWKAESVPTFHFNIEHDLPKHVDKARDFQHPGRQTIKLWAKYIADKLNKII